MTNKIWLRVEWRFKSKIATLTFKTLETGLPLYLAQQLSPTRALRSSISKFLQVPHCNLRFGSHSFCVSAPTLWNSLPQSIHFCESLTTFWKHLKTFYFKQHSLTPPSNPLPQCLRFNCGFLAIYKFTYLLTYLLKQYGDWINRNSLCWQHVDRSEYNGQVDYIGSIRKFLVVDPQDVSASHSYTYSSHNSPLNHVSSPLHFWIIHTYTYRYTNL